MTADTRTTGYRIYRKTGPGRWEYEITIHDLDAAIRYCKYSTSCDGCEREVR